MVTNVYLLTTRLRTIPTVWIQQVGGTPARPLCNQQTRAVRRDRTVARCFRVGPWWDTRKPALLPGGNDVIMERVADDPQELPRCGLNQTPSAATSKVTPLPGPDGQSCCAIKKCRHPKPKVQGKPS